MGADPVRADRLPGRERGALMRAVLALALAAHCMPSTAAGAAPTVADVTPDVAAPLIDKPASLAKRPAAGLVWNDAGVRRPLFLDTGLRADFSPGLSGKAAVLRRADGPLKDVSVTLQSPVLRDESGRARALPGGVLLVIDAALDDTAARALIERHAAVPVRRIAGPVWLVASPPGLASLDLANRLADAGAFGSAQPNWWVERPLK